MRRARLRCGKPELVQRDRLGRSKNAHHHVFQPVAGRDGRHAQFDAMLRRELGEVDLAVLRLALLADVEVAHDLHARDDRVAVAGRQFQVGVEPSVAAKADAGLFLARIALDMDVRHALAVRLEDHAVDHPHQRVVRLLDRRFFVGEQARGLPSRGSPAVRWCRPGRIRWAGSDRKKPGRPRPARRSCRRPCAARRPGRGICPSTGITFIWAMNSTSSMAVCRPAGSSSATMRRPS